MNVAKRSRNETGIQHGRYSPNALRPLDDCNAARGDSTADSNLDAWLEEIALVRPLFEDEDARAAWEHVS